MFQRFRHGNPRLEAEGTVGGSGWDSPGTDDINAALDKAGITFPGEEPRQAIEAEESKPAPAPEPTEEGGEKLAPAAEAEVGQAKPEAAEVTGEEAELVELHPGQKFRFKNLEYTAEEFEEGIRSGLRQADYTRKTQVVSEKNREADEKVRRLDEERRQFEAERERASLTPEGRRQMGAEANAAEKRMAELLEDPDITEAQRELAILTLDQIRETREIFARAEERRERAAQARANDQAIQDYESTFESLCKSHSVSDQVDRENLHDRVLGIILENLEKGTDPEVATREDLEAEVARVFEQAHKALTQRHQRIRKETLDGLKKLPVPPASKGGSPIPPTKPAGPPPTLDDESATTEFMQRYDRLRGVS